MHFLSLPILPIIKKRFASTLLFHTMRCNAIELIKIIENLLREKFTAAFKLKENRLSLLQKYVRVDIYALCFFIKRLRKPIGDRKYC